jgi:O-antigen ligase
MLKNLNLNYYFILLSLIPISIIIGSSISLINILIIGFIFLFFSLNKKTFFLFREKTIICFFIIYIYLIFNSLIAVNIDTSLLRNIGFVRFIFLFLAVNYIFFNFKKVDFIFKTWILILLVVLIDCFYEIIFGQNILGYSVAQGSFPQGRIVSFFKDELVIVAFLNGFFFMVIGFLFSGPDMKKINKNFLIFLILLMFLGFVIFSGERSNTIKALIGLFIFFIFNNQIKLKIKIFVILITTIFFMIVFNQSLWVKYRYGNDFLFKIFDKDKREKFVNENLYFNLYKSGLEVFKKNPYFGVGNKNYRVVSCEVDSPLICNTHPHQIYIELLAEHGLFGSILLLSILLYLMFKNLKIIILSRNMIQIGALSYLLINFIPILPGGSFFADFNATLFWLNFSIFYASNPKTNIFNKINN